MFCPNCGYSCEDGHNFCLSCGTPLPKAVPVESPIPPAAAAPEPVAPETISVEQAAVIPPVEPPKPRKGRIWPPIAAMSALVVVGVLLFFFSGYQPAVPPAQPQYENVEADYFYVSDGVLWLRDELYTGSADLEIPAMVNGEIITAIGDSAFAGCDSIVSVTLPETVISIGNNAFAGCTRLRAVKLSEGIRAIGHNAFAQCAALEAITIPSTLEFISQDAFTGCSALEHIFFAGTHETWKSLYFGPLLSTANVYCTDGDFTQGE